MWCSNFWAIRVQSWTANTEPFDDESNYILIEGTAGSISGRLLAAMGRKQPVKFKVNAAGLSLSLDSSFGEKRVWLPLEHIQSIAYGWVKPLARPLTILVLALITAAVFYVGTPNFFGFVMTAVSLLAGGAASFALLAKRRAPFLRVQVAGGGGLSIHFFRGAQRKEEIAEDEAVFLGELLEYLVEAKAQRLARL